MTDPDVKSLVADLVQREYEGQVSAVGIVAVLKDGDMRIVFAAPDGTKLALHTAAALLERDILDKFKRTK